MILDLHKSLYPSKKERGRTRRTRNDKKRVDAKLRRGRRGMGAVGGLLGDIQAQAQLDGDMHRGPERIGTDPRNRRHFGRRQRHSRCQEGRQPHLCRLLDGARRNGWIRLRAPKTRASRTHLLVRPARPLEGRPPQPRDQFWPRCGRAALHSLRHHADVPGLGGDDNATANHAKRHVRRIVRMLHGLGSNEARKKRTRRSPLARIAETSGDMSESS